MSLHRFLFFLLTVLPAVIVTGCTPSPDAEAVARKELAERGVSIDIAGLKEATGRRSLDGAYLFEATGYFSTISDGDFKEALKHAAATQNFGLSVMLERYSKEVQFPAAELMHSLDTAARRGSRRMAALLIRHGAEPGPGTLFHSAYTDDYGLVDLLLRNGGDFTDGRNSEALRMAARLGNLNSLKAFVESGRAPKELVDQAILYGALTEKSEVVRYLVETGVDVNHEDSDGCTALHYLAQDGPVDIVRYLVERGAQVNKTCRGNETPLKWAHYGDNSEVIDFLVGVGGVQK